MPPEWSHSTDEEILPFSKSDSLSNGAHKVTHTIVDLGHNKRLCDHFNQRMLSEIGAIRFQKWFEGRTSVTIEGNILTIGVPSPFLMNWMRKEFEQAARKAAQQCLGPSAEVRFDVAEGMNTAEDLVPSTVSAAPAEPSAPETLPRSTKQVGRLAPRRRRFASLDHFIAGSTNVFPLHLARQVAENPGDAYNPLYYYGGVGIGKTHLLEGIHSQVRQQFPDWQVMLLTAEAFGNYYTKALQEKSLPAFRRRFRSIDVLIVDDIEFLDSKKGFQEEFCHTIQELISYGRQIILAGDRHPKMLTNVRPDLSTRFSSGIIARVEAPDLETRRQIVVSLAERNRLPISDDAIDFVATKFSRNVREMIGAVNCLQTYNQMTKRRIGITATREVLRDLERDCLRIIRTEDVQHSVCQLFGVEQQDLVSSKRARHLSQPRMVAMYLSRQWTASAYHEIGRQFGGRNHSTVMSAEKRIKKMLDNDEAIQISARQWPLREVIATIEEELQVG